MKQNRPDAPGWDLTKIDEFELLFCWTKHLCVDIVSYCQLTLHRRMDCTDKHCLVCGKIYQGYQIHCDFLWGKI
jgi:hypothetical protein